MRNATNAARAHSETRVGCSVGQGNPFGEGGVPGKRLRKTRGEEGMSPDRRHGRAGGGKIQARIQSVIEPTALASFTPYREWRGRGIVRGGAGDFSERRPARL